MNPGGEVWREFVPPAKHAAVAKALRSAFGITEVEEAARLAGGASAAVVLRIVVNARPYVLRIILEVNALNDPVRQFTCLSTAADAGISPRVLYADADDALSLTDFIPTVPLREHPGSPLVALAETIKAIQATPLFPPLVNYMDGIDGLIQRVQAMGMLPERATGEHFQLYARIQQAYPRHDPNLVSSHNDLNPRNILFDGARLWVIDWETAFCNDRYADLANAANFFFREEAETGEPGMEEETLLRAYFGDAPSEYQRARFFLMRPINQMFYAMLLTLSAAAAAGPAHDGEMETPRLRDFHRQFAGPITERDPLASPEGQFLYAKVWLNEALHHMKTPRFEESIRMMENPGRG